MKMSITKMNREEKMLILKLAICTVICTLFAWLVKDPYRVTAAVTANLYLYIDRGYRGGKRFAYRRAVRLLSVSALMERKPRGIYHQRRLITEDEKLDLVFDTRLLKIGYAVLFGKTSDYRLFGDRLAVGYREKL